MSNLIAYVPVLNQRHINWFQKHENSCLFLITQKTAEDLLPRLQRNMSAVPTETMVQMLRATKLVKGVFTLDSSWARSVNLIDGVWQNWVLPDEDISHLVADKFLKPKGAKFEFEMIWARWDMTAVSKAQPVIVDVSITTEELHLDRMKIAQDITPQSPDWWRQIGAVAFDFDGLRLAVAKNTHMPNEYETYIFGDPRLNVDAGQKGKYCALHAERAVVAMCARYGYPLAGSSLYVTTFPCEDCAREIAFAGIKNLYFKEGYSVLNAQEVLRAEGVRVIQVVEDPVSA
jgi:dCMP deaminase